MHESLSVFFNEYKETFRVGPLIKDEGGRTILDRNSFKATLSTKELACLNEGKTTIATFFYTIQVHQKKTKNEIVENEMIDRE